MEKDLKITCTILNLTLDELVILLHLITYGFMKLDQNVVRNSYKSSFDSKSERQNWEDNFNRTYLKTYLTDIQTHINKANNQIQTLNQDGQESQQSKIYFMAYELLKEPPFKMTYLYESEKFWKFRATVTFDSMAIDLINTTHLREQFKIIKKFYELKSKLKLVFNLPDIIKLVNFLNKKLYKSIFKYTAQNKTIGQFISELDSSEEFPIEKIKSAINSFQMVWSYGKQNFKEYVKKNISNTILLQTDYEFNLNSKLSYFLPTKYGEDRKSVV